MTVDLKFHSIVIIPENVVWRKKKTLNLKNASEKKRQNVDMPNQLECFFYYKRSMRISLSILIIISVLDILFRPFQENVSFRH